MIKMHNLAEEKSVIKDSLAAWGTVWGELMWELNYLCYSRNTMKQWLGNPYHIFYVNDGNGLIKRRANSIFKGGSNWDSIWVQGNVFWNYC